MVGAELSFSCKKREFDRFFNRLDRPVEESRPDRFPYRCDSILISVYAKRRRSVSILLILLKVDLENNVELVAYLNQICVLPAPERETNKLLSLDSVLSQFQLFHVKSASFVRTLSLFINCVLISLKEYLFCSIPEQWLAHAGNVTLLRGFLLKSRGVFASFIIINYDLISKI